MPAALRMSPMRECLIYAGIGGLFLISSLVFAFFSASIAPFGFHPILRYNAYMELLSLVFAGTGGFFLFRAGQSKPATSVLRKSLAEQVKSVKESK
jgi:hypothetical protein